MRTWQKLLLILFALILLAAGWVWWNRPQRVDMAGYVPADSMIYIESNSLPEVLGGVVSTDAWKALAPGAGIETDFGRIGWLSRLAALTGIGSADAVVLARAQLAVTVLSFETAEESGATLKISPRVALVAETHTSETRVRAAVEKLVGDFARKAYGSPRVERAETDDAFFVTWTAQTDERRRIVAAVSDSVAVIGNDRSTVEACLAARRGERPTLAADAQLQEMRARMGAGDALAFGYVPPGKSARLLEVAAVAYVGQVVSDPQVQSVVASLLPQLANKILGGAAWSTRVKGGAIEDDYFLALESNLASRLSASLSMPEGAGEAASEFLPADTYQLTRYSYEDPEATWRAFSAALFSQVDAFSAPLLGRFLEAMLKPYGIEAPREFLRAAGTELATARLDNGGGSTVLVVGVRDRAALQTEVRKHLGAGARSVAVGDATMLVSTDEEHSAASFVADRLLMGREQDVRRCLEARQKGATLSAAASFRQATRRLFDTAPPGVLTLTDDADAARVFVSYFAPRRAQVRQSPPNDETLRRTFASHAYAATESRFVADGYERRTLSSFGNFGTIVARFAPDARSQ